MRASFEIGPRVVVLVAVALSGIVAHGQTRQLAPNNDSLAVSLKMKADQIQIGQKPWAIVTVSNITGQAVIFRESMCRVYVYGKDGEAPTTLVQREFTGTLRPSHAALRGDDNVGPQTVWPTGGAGDSLVREFDLTYLYDLSAPGKYTAYAEVLDPSSNQWLRSKPVTFEMKGPAQ
ncbi:MAG TPA: hypothetical protein VGH38_23325 [Bryobacteraceae bacterium]|jgi:hypothetical protein